MKYILILVLVIVSSCNETSPPKNYYSISSIFDYDFSKVYILKDSNLIIRDTAGGGIKGGRYEFFQNKNLKSYVYFVDSNRYSYCEKYDSLGNSLQIIGRPVVDYFVKNHHKDSFFVKFYLFNLNRKFRNISVKIDSNRTVSLPIEMDSSRTNMSMVQFNSEFIMHKISTIVLKVPYLDLVKSKEETFMDTFYIDNDEKIQFYRKR